jgi:hypothetical protein
MVFFLCIWHFMSKKHRMYGDNLHNRSGGRTMWALLQQSENNDKVFQMMADGTHPAFFELVEKYVRHSPKDVADWN